MVSIGLSLWCLVSTSSIVSMSRKPFQLRRIVHNDGKQPLANQLVPLNQVVNCGKCKKPIAESFVRLASKSFHLNCFLCSTCSRPLRDLKVYEDDLTLYCEECYSKQVDKCAKCSEDILDEVVTVSSTEKYHRNCFCCGKCSNPLESEFFEHQGVRYCREDYLAVTSLNCTKCGQPIRPSNTDVSPMQIKFGGKSFHPDCFLCDQCGTGLDSVSTSTQNSGSSSSKPKSSEQETHQQEESEESLKGSETESTGNGTNQKAVKVNKVYYPIDGLKLCKNCAKQRHKQKKQQKKATQQQLKNQKQNNAPSNLPQ